MSTHSVTAVLLLSCPDQKGLVASVSDFVYRNNGNIIHADQHTDAQQGIFLQRVEWELHGFRIPRVQIGEAFQETARRFGISWQLHFSDHVPRLALFVSRQPHCLHDLLLRRKLGEFQAEIPLVISNHPDHAGAAESFGAEYRYVPITPGSKAAQEELILDSLDCARIDLIVLARYMQILTPAFVEHFPNRIINIHHSFLPAFAGARPYHQAYDRGVKIVGATAHYVTANLDQGPIIEQDVVRVSHRDNVEELIRKGRDLEKVVLARAVGLHLRNRIIVYGNKTTVFD